ISTANPNIERKLDINRNLSAANGQLRSLFIPPSSSSRQILCESQNVSEELSTLFASFGAFWLHKSFRRFFEVYITAVALFGATFPFSLRVLWNRKRRANIFTKWIQYPTIHYPFNLWDFIDHRIIRHTLLMMMAIRLNVRTKTIKISSQEKILIAND